MMKHLRTQQTGLSLVELLVSLVISGIVMAGVVNSLLASKNTYINDEQVAYIQENARFAVDIIARDLRETGFMGGCNQFRTNTAAALNPSAAQAQFLGLITTGLGQKLNPIEGFEGGVDTFPSQFSADVWSTTTDPDAIIIRKLDSNGGLMVMSHSGGTATITVPSNDGISAGDLMMIADSRCRQMGIFAVSSTALTDQVLHAAGAAGSSTNCTGNMGSTVNCPAAGASYTYDAGSTIFPLQAKAYYIGPSSYDSNTPALFVEGIGSGGAIVKEELVSGVENLEITYGIDNQAGSPDGRANQYLAANNINADVAGAGNGWVAWDRVVSVRISLLLRSRDAVLLSDHPTYGDRFLRQTVSTTVQLRNAALPGNAP